MPGYVSVLYTAEALGSLLDLEILGEVKEVRRVEGKEDEFYFVVYTKGDEETYESTFGVKPGNIVGAVYDQDEFGTIRMVGLDDTEEEDDHGAWFPVDMEDTA